jgi:hypothetical protein
MDHDDDPRDLVGPEELLTPPGPRRASYTPPAGDAQSLEAAANIFNDDMIAAAMAAELAKLSSGRPPVISVPVPEPVAETPASTPPAPEVATPEAVVPEPLVPAAPVIEPTNAGPFPLDPPPAEVMLDAVPAPYVGAPPPTVPAADVPPPPGYEHHTQTAPRTPAHRSLDAPAENGFPYADFRFAPPEPEAPVEAEVPFPGNASPAEPPYPGFPDEGSVQPDAATVAEQQVASPPAPAPDEYLRFAPPPLVEPPAPDLTYPVFSDQIGVIPPTTEPTKQPLTETAPYEDSLPQLPTDVPSVPPADFESLLSGALRSAEPDASSAGDGPPPAWLTAPAPAPGSAVAEEPQAELMVPDAPLSYPQDSPVQPAPVQPETVEEIFAPADPAPFAAPESPAAEEEAPHTRSFWRRRRGVSGG